LCESVVVQFRKVRLSNTSGCADLKAGRREREKSATGKIVVLIDIHFVDIHSEVIHSSMP